MLPKMTNTTESLPTAENPAKYTILLSFTIPSLLLFAIIFFHISKTPAARSLHSHVIIVLLCLTFLQVSTDLPILMSVFHTGQLHPPSPSFCTFWVWYDFSLNAIGVDLMAFASIERHIIVFKFNFFRNQMKRYLLHYLPIIVIICWIPFFYMITVIISPTCQQDWDYHLISCGQPCFVLYDKYLSGFDFIFHLLIPVFIITLSNIALCIRVIYQKRNVQQVNTLRQQQKMTIQLVSIALLYIIGWLPAIITQLIQLYFDQYFLIDQLEYILFLIYFIPLLIPFVCLRAVPQLMKRLRIFINQNQTKTDAIQIHSLEGSNRPISNLKNIKEQ